MDNIGMERKMNTFSYIIIMHILYNVISYSEAVWCHACRHGDCGLLSYCYTHGKCFVSHKGPDIVYGCMHTWYDTIDFRFNGCSYYRSPFPYDDGSVWCFCDDHYCNSDISLGKFFTGPSLPTTQFPKRNYSPLDANNRRVGFWEVDQGRDGGRYGYGSLQISHPTRQNNHVTRARGNTNSPSKSKTETGRTFSRITGQNFVTSGARFVTTTPTPFIGYPKSQSGYEVDKHPKEPLEVHTTRQPSRPNDSDRNDDQTTLAPAYKSKLITAAHEHKISTTTVPLIVITNRTPVVTSPENDDAGVTPGVTTNSPRDAHTDGFSNDARDYDVIDTGECGMVYRPSNSEGAQRLLNIPCPEGFEYHDRMQCCYRFVRLSLNHSEAAEYCHGLHQMAALMSLETVSEYECVVSRLHNESVLHGGWQGWWTSGKYNETLREFIWSSPGHMISRLDRRWLASLLRDPYDNTCVWLVPQAHMHFGNYFCGQKSGFVCEVTL